MEYYFIILALIFLGLFSALTLKHKLTIFFFMVLFPLSPGNLGPISNFEFSEILTPVILFFLVLDFLYYRRKFLFSKVTKIFFATIGLIVLWAILSYIRNPAPYNALFGGVGGTGGVRAYYSILVGCTVFFAFFRLFAYEEINFENLLKILLATSIIIGFSRILGYFYDFNLPLGGAFSYAGEPGIEFGGESTYRIGGIDLCIQIGLSSLFGLFFKNRNAFLLFPLLFLFLVLAFFGGGRMIFASFFLVTIFYFSIFNRKKIYIAIISLTCFILIYNFLNQHLDIPQQFNRLLFISSFEKDTPRSELFANYLNTFSQNPLLGKGIDFFTEADEDDFIKLNLAVGGHNAYLSSLAIFGIVGGFFLVTMLFGTIFLCTTCIKKTNDYHAKQFLVFLLVITVVQVFIYLVGGTGYKDILLYFIAGSALGIHTKLLIYSDKYEQKVIDYIA